MTWPIAVVAAAAMVAGHAQVRHPFIAQVDHVMFVSGEHARVIRLLADTLGLPIVWPEPGSTWSTTTGIGFGNGDVEIVHSNRATPFLSSLAFQAADWPSLVPALRQTGVPLLDPGVGPFDSTHLDRGPRWSIQAVSGFGRGMFFIRYNHFDQAARRATTAAELSRRGGGALGVVRLREIIVAIDSAAARTPLWSKLLGPRAQGSVAWTLGNGPAVSLVEKTDPRADLLVVQVRSLPSAMRTLDSLGIRYTAQRDEVRLDVARFGGLRLALVR